MPAIPSFIIVNDTHDAKIVGNRPYVISVYTIQEVGR